MISRRRLLLAKRKITRAEFVGHDFLRRQERRKTAARTLASCKGKCKASGWQDDA
jgi:hypothetical protein